MGYSHLHFMAELFWYMYTAPGKKKTYSITISYESYMYMYIFLHTSPEKKQTNSIELEIFTLPISKTPKSTAGSNFSTSKFPHLKNYAANHIAKWEKKRKSISQNCDDNPLEFRI